MNHDDLARIIREQHEIRAGCGELLTLDWADGWHNTNGLTCWPTNTTRTDRITTIEPIGAGE